MPTTTAIDWNPTVAIWEAVTLDNGGIAAGDTILWEGPLQHLQDRNGAPYGVLMSGDAACWTVTRLQDGCEQPLNGYRL